MNLHPNRQDASKNQLKNRVKHSLMLACLLLISVIGSSVSVAPAQAQSEVQTHYWLARPLPKTAVVSPQLGFLYGWDRRGQSPIHHGDDYLNPRGTPVIAAGSGTVFFAGSDADTVFGPQPNFYGNVIVIQHDLTAPEGGTVYTLYGHLSEINVQAGQPIGQGQLIGHVGSTGIAIGAHLHFEVRVGDPRNYGATRNPELWYPPLAGHATLIGRMLDANGGLVLGTRFALSNASIVLPSFSYNEPNFPNDPMYGENLVMGDIPAGCYQLRVRGGAGYLYNAPICFKSGQTLFLEIKLSS